MKPLALAFLALALLGCAMFPATVVEAIDSVRRTWLNRQYDARFTACLRTHNLPTGPEKPHTAFERRQRSLCQDWALDDTYGRR